ncbi:MAG TPA: regulatory protein RecX [Actinomycetota bacterium]
MPSSYRRRGEPKNPKTCHERALGLLAVRPRSRRELERRLLAASFERSEVDDVLARLERVGLVDDHEFARQMAEYQYGSRRAGRRAVTGALMEKGIAPEVIAQVIDEAPDDEEDRALALAGSRALRMGSVEPAKAFTRLTGLLVRRGYSPDVARRAARTALTIDQGDD